MFCPNPYKRPSIESGAENRGSIESKNQLQKARKWSYPKYLFILELKILVTKQTWFACVPPVYMIYNQHNTAYHQQHIRHNIGQHSTNNTVCKRSQPWIDNMLQLIWHTFWGVGLSFMVCLFGFLVMVLFGISGIPGLVWFLRFPWEWEEALQRFRECFKGFGTLRFNMRNMWNMLKHAKRETHMKHEKREKSYDKKTYFCNIYSIH